MGLHDEAFCSLIRWGATSQVLVVLNIRSPTWLELQLLSPNSCLFNFSHSLDFHLGMIRIILLPRIEILSYP